MYLIFIYSSNEEKEFWFFQQVREVNNSIVALRNIFGTDLSPVLTPYKYYLRNSWRTYFIKAIHLP
jgi:hypothetical protein